MHPGTSEPSAPRAGPLGLGGGGQAPGRGRRGFLVKLTLGLNALIAAALGLPVIAYLADPLRRRRGSAGSFVRIARLDDLVDSEPKKVGVRGQVLDAWTRASEERLGAVWLVRSGSRVTAYSTICPHLGCGVDFRARERKFACPCHGSAFAIDGRRVAGPSPRDLDPLVTRVRDGWVEVRWRRLRQGRRLRVEI